MREGKTPANFWGTMIGLASLVVSALGMLIGISKSDAQETQGLRDRLCRVEAHLGKGDCGK